MKTIANRIVQGGSALKSDENIQKLLGPLVTIEKVYLLDLIFLAPIWQHLELFLVFEKWMVFTQKGVFVKGIKHSRGERI